MSLRENLRSGGVAVGSWLNSASAIVAELMASTGFDFLTVDAEHSAVDLVQTQVLFQAMRSGSPTCAPLVRLAGNSYADNKRYMDAGAAGVIAPLINTAAQARELVQSVKYPPQGMRGVGFCRANGYGMYLQEAVEKANEQTLVCVQIEHEQAVKNIDAILGVSGVDAVIVGPYDLSASMGITAQFDHPAMGAATDKVVEACGRHGIVPGIHVVQPDVREAVRRLRQGYRLLAYSLDITMLIATCREGLEGIQRGFSATFSKNTRKA